MYVEPDPDYVPQFAAPADVPPDGRKTRNILVGGVLTLAMILGVVWGWSYLRDRPVRAALADATAAYSRLLGALGSAETLHDVRAAAGEADEVVKVLEEAESDLAGHEGDLAEAALDLVRHEHDLASAVNRLTGLSDKDLGVWGEAEASLGQARSDVVAAREVLAGVDSDEAQKVDDPAKAIDNLRSVVGHAATRVLTRSVTDLVERLGAAERTADVRRVADDARDESAAADAALVGLSGDSADTVGAIATALQEAARLFRLDADHLIMWDDLRVPLTSALGRVADAGGVPDRFGSLATKAVDNLDSLVTVGKAAMERWRVALARAERKQARAQRTVTTYATAVREQLVTYRDVRAALADFFAQVEEGSEALDARAVLRAAVDGRRDVLAALRQLDVPPVLEEPHVELEDVLQRAVDVVQAALGDLDAEYYCDGCDYAASESYQTFTGDSEQLAADFGEAETAWREAVKVVEESISDKALPKKPRV